MPYRLEGFKVKKSSPGAMKAPQGPAEISKGYQSSLRTTKAP